MAWLILASSLATLATHRLISFILLLLGVVTAVLSGIMRVSTLLLCIVVAAVSFIRIHYQHHLALKISSEIVLIACAIGLFIHLFPGFNNLKYLDKVTVGTHSAPFTMYFNFDKALVPFILLACLPTLFVCRPAKHATKVQWVLLVISVPLLLLVATTAGGLAFEWHFPSWLPVFVLCNLLFVSLAEEALFRGYLQQRLTQWFGSPYLALILTALLFGGVHFAGEPLLILFAVPLQA